MKETDGIEWKEDGRCMRVGKRGAAAAIKEEKKGGWGGWLYLERKGAGGAGYTWKEGGLGEAVFDTGRQMCVANGLHGAASHNVEWI